MLLVLFSLVAGFLDRVRGGYPEKLRPHWVGVLAKYLIGVFVVGTFVHTRPFQEALLFMALGGVLLAQGWRWDNGWRGRWTHWAVGERKFGKDMLAKAMLWGARVNLGLVCIVYWVPELLLLAIFSTLCSPLTMAISMIMPRTETFLQCRYPAPWSEFLHWPVTLSVMNIVGII